MKDQNPWLLGHLSPSKADTVPHYIEPSHNFPTPTRITNSMMPNAAPGEITRLMTGTVRAGSDHRHPSRGWA